MKYQIDRSIPIPIARQVKGQTIRAISRGVLQPGDRLPSLRELAASLGVSYASVAGVYGDLARDGLVTTRPGKGAFVADLADVRPNGANSDRQRDLGYLVDVLVDQAALLGYESDEVRRAVLARLAEDDKRRVGGYVVLVGYAQHATECYAREIEALFQDLVVKVQCVLLADLRRDAEGVLARLHPSRLAITVVMALHEVRTLLEPRGFHVASLAFRVSTETRRRLTAIPPDRRVGVVATEPEYVLPLAQEVASYVSPELSDASVLRAVRGQNRQIKSMLDRVDVVVYNTGCEEILKWIPSGVEAIEYLHSPEPDSVLRLQPLLLS